MGKTFHVGIVRLTPSSPTVSDMCKQTQDKRQTAYFCSHTIKKQSHLIHDLNQAHAPAMRQKSKSKGLVQFVARDVHYYYYVLRLGMIGLACRRLSTSSPCSQTIQGEGSSSASTPDAFFVVWVSQVYMEIADKKKCHR